MTAPANPAIADLCAEGLKKAGYSSGTAQYTTLLARAQSAWMEEIKADLYTLSNQLKSLIATYVHITVENQSRYDMPSDFEANESMVLMDATHYGTAQAGAAASLTLAADEDVSEGDIEGRDVVIYDGTGKNQIAQCISYDETTKVATFPASSFSTAPDNTSKYMIVDDISPLDYMSIDEHDLRANELTVRDKPRKYTIKDNATYGEFLLYPAPKQGDSGLTVWAIKQRYYANITLIDTAETTGKIMSTLYRKWRNMWIQGIFARALKNDDDARAEREEATYFSMVKAIIAKESPPPDSNDFIEPCIE